MMAHADADIASMVFRQAVLKSTGDFSIDHRTLAILLEFDANRTVAQIARRLNIDLEPIYAVVRRLSGLGLIEPVTDAATALDPAVINFLTQHLARAVGPLAAVLVEDEILDLGYETDQFPKVRLRDLINRLSACIRKENKKKDFLAAVAELIQMK